MDRKVPVGKGRDGAPDLPQPRVPRRHARRARVDQRDLRRRDEDELRALPAVLDLPVGGARQAVGEREGARVQREGRGPAVPRPPQPPPRRRTCVADYAELGLPAGPFASAGFYAPPTPGRPERPPVRHRPHERRHRVLVDARRVLRRRAAALRLRRRRGRAQPVHDGDPHGGGAAAAGGHRRSATARSRSRARSCAPTTRWSSSSPTGSPTRTPAATGRARSPAPARSTRSCAGCGRRSSRCAASCAATCRTRPARRVTTEGQQVTVVDLHNLPERAQRFVVGVVLAAETARKEAAGAGGLLFTMIDELNKYAPREGVEPDQGGAARHRRARPFAGHHPHRRAADGVARWSGGSSPTRRSRWSGGWTRPRRAVRSTGSCRRRSAPARRWPSRARCSSRSRRSRCRWPSSSRSRRGRRGCRSRRARRRGDERCGPARPVRPARHRDRGRRRPLLSHAAVRPHPATPVRTRHAAGHPRSRRSPLYHGRAMRFLHTADWHVGKTLKGRSRLDEQEQVLREIVGIARAHEVDAVLVAGDLYDTRGAHRPRPRSSSTARCSGWRSDGVEVIAIAGNHDHAATIDAYRGFAKAAGITLVGTVRTAGNGGLVEFTARSTGERATARRAAVPLARATRCGPPSSSRAPRPSTPAPTTSSSATSWASSPRASGTTR